MTETDLTYKEAVSELGAILNELEASEIDVDLLSKKVSRGNELIQFCQQRLEKVSKDVSDVIGTMNSNDSQQASE